MFGEYRDDPDHMDYIHQILTWFVLAKDDVGVTSARSLNIVGIPTNVTVDFIDRLRSVLVVEEHIDLDTRMRPCHASFPQFLADPARCQDPDFVVEPQSGHDLVAHSLLELMARANISALPKAPDGQLPWMWRYGNTRWPHHLIRARYTDQLGQLLRAFAETHLMHWLRGEQPWELNYLQREKVGWLAEVRGWYLEHRGSDKELVVILSKIIDERCLELRINASELSKISELENLVHAL
ncbi:hypothetical protein OBBRIDRAFT_789095 [Obba rivulosa]|uniref:Uncharacterized protein n=1 Tax=Obba rivulosa TaxID=1052685 RepID=A0A8E2DRV4_9APHY|nr:hypothetical protein OBBRIDRAFT_789095 [Obba rivulosa]